ncbi:MAG: hypothetical protein C3F12_05765 [Candidatus Methylomirabilota bacterium]|nr:MAG: hypothetical protein C3F12_05765 [candidate division NC10 bacterium]
MKPQDEGICLNPAGRWAIRPYRSGDEGRILSLFQDVFSVDRTLEHWRWKFQANPAGSDYIRLAEAPSGELVGQYAALPVRVSWGATTQIFTQIIDVMVDRRFRLGLKRPGLFAALANAYITDYLVSGKVAVGYGFPTPEAMRVGERVAGYVPLHPVVRLVLELNDHRGGPLPWRASRFRVEPVDRFGEDVDRLWTQVGPSVGVATVRDAGYLNWRYADCPDVRYILLAARRRFGGSLAGIAVLRLGIADQSIAFLVDWLVPDGALPVAQALLAYCETAAREAGMTQLQAWFRPSGWPTQLLLERGYRSEPTLYHLVALTKTPEISLERVNAQWYYTMGDSDIY